MGDIIKFIAGLFLVAFLLLFTIPLLWLVWKMLVWLFGGLFIGVVGTNLVWAAIIIISIVAIIVLASN